MCDYVAVMYAGRIVEQTDVRTFFKDPKHPYSKALLESIPRIDDDARRLRTIGGIVPSLINPPAGCAFHPRCPYAMDICRTVRPELLKVADGHTAACHLYN
jgi:oligopeptide/dipeptide ABC transporter ATP-binding protein